MIHAPPQTQTHYSTVNCYQAHFATIQTDIKIDPLDLKIGGLPVYINPNLSGLVERCSLSHPQGCRLESCNHFEKIMKKEKENPLK